MAVLTGCWFPSRKFRRGMESADNKQTVAHSRAVHTRRKLWRLRRRKLLLLSGTKFS
jgi:hypothetical protein